VFVTIGTRATRAILGLAFAQTGMLLAQEGSLRIPLYPYAVPPMPTVSGVLVRARVNGGPALRLLLDSGSQYLVLNRKAAAKSGCTGGSDFPMVGAGDGPPKQVKSLLAAVVAIGDFLAHDVPTLVAGESIADGIDGVAPLTLFAEYLIRLDFRHKSLELVPYEANSPGQDDLPVLSNNDLLFVKCKLNRNREGYFLFDTGASYNAISRKLADSLSDPDLLDRGIALQGGVSGLMGQFVGALTNMRFGPVEFRPTHLVAIDLSQASRHHNLEIAGLLGYPALRDLAVQVNYRDTRIQVKAAK
jgi:predicted aspartyl protease